LTNLIFCDSEKVKKNKINKKKLGRKFVKKKIIYFPSRAERAAVPSLREPRGSCGGPSVRPCVGK